MSPAAPARSPCLPCRLPTVGLTTPPVLAVHLALQDQLVSGAALRLECNCRGDLALRHRDCALKWVQVKGSNVCELCKAEIRNIPAPPPRAAEADLPQLDEAYFAGGLGGRVRGWSACRAANGGEPHAAPAALSLREAGLCVLRLRACKHARLRRAHRGRPPACLAATCDNPARPPAHLARHPPPLLPCPADPSHIHDFMPSSQDLVFDCIRVTWVAMVRRQWQGGGGGSAGAAGCRGRSRGATGRRQPQI